MENSEEVLQILERFTKLKQKDIPKELEDYLCYVAKTGDTVFQWSNVKYLFREKLVHVIKDFHDTTPSIDDLPQYPNVDPFNYETMKSSLLERLEMFNAAPFTIQRLCELLTDPRKQYSRIDKFMRALEKNILVVSTVEPGRKQPESENGDSLDSVVNGDLSLDVNVDIDMEGESIFGMEPQNTITTATSVVAITPSSSSSTSEFRKSDATEDSEASLPKKAKLEINENKIKSDNESESETSDDSDSSDSKEISKEEIIKSSIKSADICEINQQANSTTNTSQSSEKNHDERKTQCDLKIEKVESISEVTDIPHKEKTHKEKEALESKVNSTNLDKESKTMTINPIPLTDTITSVLKNVESEEKNTDELKEQEKNDEGMLMLKNQEPIKLDNAESCVKKTGKSEFDTKSSNNKIEENEIIVSDTSSNSIVNADNAKESSAVVITNEVNQKETLTYSKCDEAISSISSSSEDIIVPTDKIPTEQMYIEDSSPSSTLLLPQIQQQQQQCSNQETLPIMVTSSEPNKSTPSSTVKITESQQIPDQSMDENLDATINVCRTTMEKSNNDITSSSSDVIDEVMQSSETEQMENDTMKTIDNNKIDISGMDVDDSNQEEAMDQ